MYRMWPNIPGVAVRPFKSDKVQVGRKKVAGLGTGSDSGGGNRVGMHGKIGKKIFSVRHVCQVCSKEFRTQSGLWKHASQHTGKFSFTCEECGKGFNDRDRFDAHKNRHIGAGFACIQCKKTFYSRSQLKSHMKECSFFVSYSPKPE